MSVGTKAADINASLSTDSTYYSPDGILSIDLILENTGTVEHAFTSIVTDWLSLTVQDFEGKPAPVFTSLDITADIKTPPGDTRTSAGDFDKNADLNITNAVLSPSASITYHINAKVNSRILTRISLKALVDGTATNTLTLPSGKLDFSIAKTADVSEYKPGSQVVYTIRIENTGEIPLLGMTVDDLVSQIKGQDVNGNEIPAFSSVQSITATTDSAQSSAGDFSATGPDLNAKNVMVKPKGWVSYEITATVAATLVGPITNSAEAQSFAVKKTSNDLTLNSAPENLTVDYTVSPAKKYKPSDVLTYTITLTNTGAGFASNYNVINALKALSINLANNGDTKVYDHRDVAGHPFSTWTVTVKSVSSGSVSSLGVGTVLTNNDLKDVVSVAPAGRIIYEIKANTKPEAISDIPTEVSATSAAGGTTITQSLNLTANALTDAVTVTKTPVSTEYEPGGWVTYTITATNTDSNLFADNFTIKDQIATCQKVTLADGSKGPPFSKWKLTVKSSEGAGTDPGLFDYDTIKTGDIAITADFAAAGKVVYQLDAQVNPQAVGTILDAPCPDDNVTEEGGGINAPEGKAEVLKLVDKQHFVPGSDLTYTITVKNSGAGFLTKLPVVDDLQSVTATGGSGNEPAFSGWTITTAVTDSAGGVSVNSNPDLDGTIKPNENLNTHANIYPGDTVTYTIVATTQQDLISTVTNEIRVGDDATSKTSSDPLPYELKLTKSVNKYYYSQGDNTLVYTIRIKSEARGGFANDIPVDDDFQLITAELLHPAGKQVAAFESFSIKTTASTGADAGLNSDYATKGLHAKASLPPGGYVEYTVTATIPDREQDSIVWGEITNTVSMTTKAGIITDRVTTWPKKPDIRLQKTVDQLFYKAGEVVTYHIRIDNDGDGYANDATVIDDIAALGLFKSWTFSTKTDGVGSRVVNPLVDNQNINNRVDIAPGGFVEIAIKGIVVDDISALNVVTNTVEVHDPQTGRDFDSSAQIDKNPSTVSFNVTKDGDGIYFTPGAIYTYTIGLRNDSDKDIEHLELSDNLADINVRLVNDQGGTHTDIDGTPFSRWRYKINNNPWQNWMTENIVLSDFVMKSKEENTLTIEVDVKDTVVSNKIRNEVTVEKVNLSGNNNERVGSAVYETLRTNTGGRVDREVKPELYKPGDTVTYTITASSKTGYYNNVSIADEISKIQVKTLDGSFKQPFNDQWTVAVKKNDTHNGGTTDGLPPDTGTAEDNKDLSVVIDVGANDSVIYTIKGVVRDDAIGVIDNDSLEVKPYLPNMTYNKTTLETNYLPGQVLTYELTVNNTGKVHINDLPVQDILSAVKTEDVNGKSIPAFSSWTISATTAPIATDPATGAKPAYEALYNAGSFSADKDLDVKADIPIGGSITWQIAAVVSNAAAGDITNTSIIDTNTTSVTTHPEVARYKITKTVTGVYDQSMQPLADGLYTPWGYIAFTLRLDWVSGANLVNLPVKDKLKAIQTDWFDGTKGKAFDSWTISTAVDTGGISSAGTVKNNENIDTSAIVGVNGFVEYKITARITEQAVGDISNTATVDNLKAVSDTVKMAKADLEISKKAYKNSSFEAVKDRYSPGDSFAYQITLKNNGKGTYYNQRVKDRISKVKVEIAETAKTAGKKPKAPAFVDWTVDETHTSGPVTNAGGFKGGNKVDINTVIDISPGGSITFTIIDATIRDNALGIIKNRVSSGRDEATSKLFPNPGIADVKKSIVSVGAKSYLSGSTFYRPGDTVVYQFVVTNPFNTWRNDLTIVDKLSEVMTTLSDGSVDSAFASWTVTSKAEKADGSAGITYIPSVSDTTDINIEVDLAPQETLTFTINAVVKPNAMGEIQGNAVQVGDVPSRTDPIKPAPGLINFIKTTVSSTTGNIKTYANNGDVEYSVVVKNVGEGFVQGVTIKDILSTQESTKGQLVYSNYNVEPVKPLPVQSYISGKYSGAVDLDAIANIAPGEAYRFSITGKINPDVQGRISNHLVVNDKDTSVVLFPETAQWVSEKAADSYVYSPGGTVTFTLKVTNHSDSIGTTTVIDKLSEIKVATVDGTTQPAFTSISASYEITGDKDHSLVTTPIIAGNNLNTTITLAGNLDPDPTTPPQFTSVIFTITATVRADAVGDIMNTAQVDGEDISLPKVIKPSPSAINITKVPSKTPAVYTPGETIGFDVEITNSGKGYSQDLHFEDLLADITSSVAGEIFDKKQVILAWTTAKSTFSSPESYGIEGKEINNDKGYFNDYVIAPGGIVRIHLEGQVIDTTMGDVTNKAQWSEAASGLSGFVEATYNPSESNVTLTKSALSDSYQAGQPVTFIVALANAGDGWAARVALSDELSLIQTQSLGGELIPAFKPDSLTVTTDSNPDYDETFVSGNVFITVVDIPPKTTVTYQLTATVAVEAIGDITNTAESGSQSAKKTITPDQGTPELTKTALSPFYMLDKPTGFDVTVTNKGNGSINDLVLKDAISAMRVLTMDGSKQQPFTSWTIKIQTTQGQVNVIDNHTDKDFKPLVNEDLDVTIDMLKGSAVTFRIEGDINDQIVNRIVNTATQTFDSVDTSEIAMIFPQLSSVGVVKTSDTPTYRPSKPLSFTITIANTSKVNIYQKDLVDDLEKVMVRLADGSEGPAFVTGSTSLTTKDIPATSTANKIDDNTWQLTIPPGDTLTFNASGIVVDHAVGLITNAGTFDGNEFHSNAVPRETPKIKGEFTVEEAYYVAGNPLTYHLTLTNESDFDAHDVALETKFTASTGDYITGGKGNAFDSGTITAETDESGESHPGSFEDNKDIKTLLSISANKGFVKYTIKPLVDINMVTPISVDAYFSFGFDSVRSQQVDSEKKPNAEHLAVLNVPPINGDMEIKKTPDKLSYGQDDTAVIYTLTATNPSQANLVDMILKDDLSTIKTSKGKPVFKSWTFDAYETIGGVESRLPEDQQPKPNMDLAFSWNYENYKRNSIRIEVNAVLGSDIQEPVTNTAQVIDGSSGQTIAQADAKTFIDKKSLNEGQLLVSKRAMQPEIKPGGLVEYEVIIDNPQDTTFENFALVDKYPAGFRYVKGSSMISYDRGAGFKTNVPFEPVVSQVLTFSPMTLEAFQKCRLRYVLKSTIATPHGSYKNTAEAFGEPGSVSNKSSAIVTIMGDKLFDTGSIIGKVFVDHKGNGLQSDATARQIKIKVAVPATDYIPQSTQLKTGGQYLPIPDGKQPAITQGIVVDRLWGNSHHQQDPLSRQASMRFKTKKDGNYPLEITSKSGTTIRSATSGDKLIKTAPKDARSNENLQVTKKLYQQNNQYLHEILIENIGLQDEGIPGVRLITAEGFKLTTDEFGRFHVPDQWVLDAKGKNFVIKVDEDSLPSGMKVISENPKVKRITPHQLNRFNFSVQ
jgi:uncharacterized repeat protein (TIGR01451 family)